MNYNEDNETSQEGWTMGKQLEGKELLDVLNETRDPFKRSRIRDKAIHYLRHVSDQLPEKDKRSCKDLLENFNLRKHISDQLRDLAVWVDEVNALLPPSNYEEKS